MQQPIQPEPSEQRENVISACMLLGGRTELPHQMLGSRSKYSSSSFLPPSPLPSVFSDSINSIRSIHLTILYPSWFSTRSRRGAPYTSCSGSPFIRDARRHCGLSSDSLLESADGSMATWATAMMAHFLPRR